MINLLKRHLISIKGKKIIEFGTGYFEEFHAYLAMTNNLLLTDINEIHIDPQIAKANILISDACNTKLNDELFDFAYSSMLLPYVNFESHIKEVRRILKPGGIYLIACTGPKHNIQINDFKLLGLNINPMKIEKYGAVLIDEELYNIQLKAEEINQYLREIGTDRQFKKNDSLFTLTKNFLLFELRK